MDSAQILLIVIIAILTILLLVLGVQTFLILTEFRKTLNKTNHLLDDVKSGTNIAKIIGTVLALVFGKNLGKNFLDLMGNRNEDKKPERKIEVETVVDEPRAEKTEPRKEQKKARRFFRRSKNL